MDLFSEDKNGSQCGAGSELMAYQPTPYNNNLDLNELLQNVGDVETIHNGKRSHLSVATNEI